MDLAKRAYDHGFRLDPIVRSLLDTDFYKLLMLQMIWREHRDVPVVFQVINRTKTVRLADDGILGTGGQVAHAVASSADPGLSAESAPEYRA